MGLWTTCQSLGGVAGALAATWFLTGYGWTWAYMYHVPILVGMALIDFIWISDEPPVEWTEFFKPEIASAAKSSEEDAPPKQVEETNASSSHVSVAQVIALPGVLAVGTSYFFLKFMRYALLFWLPFYYEKELGYDKGLAGYLSTSFELGGTVGTPLIGYLSDRYMAGRRDLTAGLFMAGAAISLTLCLELSDWGPAVNAFCMGLTGILVIGPDSVLSGTIAQDIGQRSGLGKSAVGSVAGLLNSMGSAGSIFQSATTAYVSRTYGWSVLFAVFVACAALSSGILFHVAAKSLPPNQSLTKTLGLLLAGKRLVV
jgi:sugar phosphate permease